MSVISPETSNVSSAFVDPSKGVNSAPSSEVVTRFFDKVLHQLETIQQPSPHIKVPKKDSASELAQLIYDKLTSAKYCKTRPDSAQEMLGCIERHIKSHKAIPVILGHGPLKNRNNCTYPHADWAELLAYLQLTRLANDLKALYEPGIEIQLYMDDARSAFANHVPWTVMDAYRQSVVQLLESTQLNLLITEVVSFKDLYANHDHDHCLDEAHQWAQSWVADPTNADQWLELVAHAHKNLVFEDQTPLEIREDEARQASFRYVWCHRAEQICGIWSDPDKLYMRYSPHEGFYQVYTFRKGSVTQPWQGAGCLLLTEQGKVDPTIMTVTKQGRYNVVETLNTPLSTKGLTQLPLVVASVAV